MPELPEVETIRRGLERRLCGARVTRVEIREPRLRRRVDEAALRALVGRRVEAVGRRAKYLLADVGEGLCWLMHLGMSGRLLLVPSGEPPGEHEHVRVEFDRAGSLRYRDPRRFGWMRVARVEELDEIAGLGPEALGAEIGGAALRALLRGTRRDIKAALLDQRVIAGIGNIYANEILFRAGVRPTRRCPRLSGADLDRIARATAAVLGEAVARRGTSFSDYFDSDGLPGTFQDVLAVFDRRGEPCRRCATPIKRRAQGGRSSFYCPCCQR
ncbi:MAG: bifunctional DNA-formamidopyrimidine glycosylase/DNA-(apurinic or apyrimidinic site) lyase [Deltaproteobacteria bacterium]|nr:bifunctional DNA-formamidopyrimidine glycosylase/DNA-(apurinic or apyrimidinic site) lyase [Deltaproteobacteria bacterium]